MEGQKKWWQKCGCVPDLPTQFSGQQWRWDWRPERNHQKAGLSGRPGESTRSGCLRCAGHRRMTMDMIFLIIRTSIPCLGHWTIWNV